MATRTNKTPTTPTTPQPVTFPFTGFLRLNQLVGNPKANPPIQPIVPVGRSTIWRKIKNGEFPAPVKLGPMTTAWRAEDIRAWIEKQGQGGAAA